MNSIEKLREQLQQRFPDGRFTVTAPVRAEDVWTLDIAHRALYYIVEWTPPGRFGVSSASEESAFGGGPDEVFSNIDDAFSALVAFLTSSRRPSPPLPALLARVREKRGVSQAELARRLGLTQATISGYERRHDIQLSTLRKIVTALGGQLQIQAVFDDGSYTIAGEDIAEKPEPSAPQGDPSKEPLATTPFSFPTLKRKGELARAEAIKAKVADRPGGLLAAPAAA